MPNPVPEKRVGLALLLIGGFGLFIFILGVSAGQKADPAALGVIIVLLILGWGLRERFKKWGAPPPPPKPPPKPAAPAGGKPAAPPPKKGGFSLPFGKKPAPPPPPKPPPPPPPPPKPKGLLGRLDTLMKPKNKK